MHKSPCNPVVFPGLILEPFRRPSVDPPFKLDQRVIPVWQASQIAAKCATRWILPTINGVNRVLTDGGVMEIEFERPFDPAAAIIRLFGPRWLRILLDLFEAEGPAEGRERLGLIYFNLLDSASVRGILACEIAGCLERSALRQDNPRIADEVLGLRRVRRT